MEVSNSSRFRRPKKGGTKTPGYSPSISPFLSCILIVLKRLWVEMVTSGWKIPSPGIRGSVSDHGQVPDNPWSGMSSSVHRPVVCNSGLEAKDGLVVSVISEYPHTWDST